MTITGSSANFTFTRVTNTLQSNMLLGSMNSSMRKILELESQISSGYRILKPSDDPLGANRTLEIQSMLDEIARYRENIQTADHRLSSTESALRNLDDLLDSAKTIMLREVGSSSTTDTRANSAIEVDNILGQALSLANSQFGNHYLFGGAVDGADPFSLMSDYVLYNGDENEESVQISAGITMAANIAGSSAFGALTTEIRGNVDLDPIITVDTLLRDLNGGEGIAAGSIIVGDGLTTTTIDLTGAETIGDVLDIINNDPAGFVTAIINGAGNGLELDTISTGNISVDEVNGNTTASDLGILQTTLVAGPLVGSDTDPALNLLSPITSLLAGAGLTSLSSQITITNGSESATIDFVGATTVQDILNRFNQAGVNIVASINDDRDGINVVSKANGTRLNIQDVGAGTSAAELGLLMTLDRMKLADLNSGIGVATVAGDDLRITRSDGVVVEVDISNATTVGDVISLINNDPENTGGLLVAGVAGTNDRLVLTDSSGGGGDLVVENIGASFGASNLGIASTVPNGAPPMVLTGSDLSPAGVQTESLFTALIRLRDALLADDTGAITRAGAMIDTSKATVLNAVAEAGARVQRLEMTDIRLEDEDVNLQTALSETRDVNIAEAIVRLQAEETTFQAGLKTAALLLQNSLLDYL
ncbi:MAG: flagellar hook-associated protein FlgL [Planctomycetota bacterium]